MKLFSGQFAGRRLLMSVTVRPAGWGWNTWSVCTQRGFSRYSFIRNNDPGGRGRIRSSRRDESEQQGDPGPVMEPGSNQGAGELQNAPLPPSWWTHRGPQSGFTSGVGFCCATETTAMSHCLHFRIKQLIITGCINITCLDLCWLFPHHAEV